MLSVCLLNILFILFFVIFVISALTWFTVLILFSLTHSLIHHFETVPNSKKLQMTIEMWLLNDFKIQIA